MRKLMVGLTRILPLCVAVLVLPALAASQSTQSLPGWYRNSGPSKISEDSAWRVVWENSYIYQHPGTDNLYWYAQVEFRNVSSQNQNFQCHGVGCPSCIKEHIRRGGTYLGYVPAEETFCTRNPNFSIFLEPGEAHYDWVIFHNVPWKGDAVSLEWGAYGSSGWVDPWSSPFSAPQPSVCPPELVRLGTCQPVSKTPEGTASNLVVLVHGCCTDATDVRDVWETFGRLIAGTIQTPGEWEIVVWDWTAYTPKNGGIWTLADANTAYDNVGEPGKPGQGSKLADAIAAAINKPSVNAYEYVHLIGHSTGARLIHGAAYSLAANINLEKKPFIHLTFLDAYTQNDKDSGKDGGQGYGYLEGYPDHYAEHYVDIGLPSTDAVLKSAYNFDITDWQHTSEEDGFSGHHWPIYWYAKSVTSTQTITYSGPFTNTTINAKGDIVIDFNLGTLNVLSGYINFTQSPGGPILCGAGDFTGSIQGNSIRLSFISRDPDPGCGFDWGLHFTVIGTLSENGRVFEGNYSINNGQQGIFQAIVSPKFKDGYPLSLEGGNELFNNLATQFPAGGCIGLVDKNTAKVCR